VWSERLGLSGKCDIVECHHDGSLPLSNTRRGRPEENDDAQLCAQALCLEEMFAAPVQNGAVFHAQGQAPHGSGI
jgi:CRISPR-associated exonuclease Cas4